MNNMIVVLCGNIGAGKTYVAHKIKKQFKSILFSADKMMLRLFGEIDGRELFIEKFTLVEETIYEIITDILENTNGNILMDFGFLTKESRKNLKKRFEKYNMVFVYINTPDNVRWERVEKRNTENNPYDYQFDKETFDYLSSLFEEFSKDEECIEYENIEKLIKEINKRMYTG